MPTSQGVSADMPHTIRRVHVAKYNPLLRIEEELADSAVYGGFPWEKP